jgi:hypothetical protein
MIYQLYDSLCRCCFRYKDENYEEIKIILCKIKNNLNKNKNLCC